MREGAENANVELGAMLAVVVVLALIRVVAAFSGEETDVRPTAQTAMVEITPRGETPAAPDPVVADDSVALLPSDAESGSIVHEEPPSPTETPEEPAEEARPRVAPPRLSADLVPALETPDESTLISELAEGGGAPSPPPANPTAPPPAPRPAPPPEERAPPTQEVFETVEQMPAIIGGLGGLQRRIRYPDLARRMGVEGRVFVQFIVNEDGSVANVRTVRGIGAGCDEAAEAAVRASRFTPGRQRGRLVKVRMTVPVTFRAD